MKPNHAEAIAQIQMLRGNVAISVGFSWCLLDDAALGCLAGLPQLQELYLSNTEVTDAGLEHLMGLRQLQTLDLSGTKVTDAGLEHLKGLRELQTLDLSGTKVTDAGLDASRDCGNSESWASAGPRSPTPVWRTSGVCPSLKPCASGQPALA